MSNDKQSVRFFTYSQFHGKYTPVGSDQIRVHNLIKYWPEANLYKYGEKPDVLIFTKIFPSQDYQFPKHFPGIKILDICDPMWMEGFNVVEMVQAMDAVTCSTKHLADFIRQFHNNVHVVDDRYDIEILPEPRKHLNEAKTVTWFGYSHNSDLLRPALSLIDELDLNLFVLSNDDPIFNRWMKRERTDFYKYQPYAEDSIWVDLQKADFAILPEGHRPVDPFKSNNRTTKANLSGLPVAKTPEELRDYINPKNRQTWLDNNYANIKKEYDCRRSIEQYQEIINEIRINSR